MSKPARDPRDEASLVELDPGALSLSSVRWTQSLK